MNLIDMEKVELPLKLDANHIMDRSGINTIAVCAEGWSDDQAYAEYLVEAANNYKDLLEKCDRLKLHLNQARSLLSLAVRELHPEDSAQAFAINMATEFLNKSRMEFP